MFHFVHRPTTVYRPMGGYLISFIPKFHSKISFIIDLIHLYLHLQEMNAPSDIDMRSRKKSINAQIYGKQLF